MSGFFYIVKNNNTLIMYYDIYLNLQNQNLK